MAAAKRRNLTLDLSPVRTSQFDELVLRPFVRKGDPFDGYVDIEEVGLGAFGSVYQAKSRSGGNPKAIKVVNAGLCETDKILKALNEAQIGMQIDHPNILPIQHVWYDRTRFFFVMDLIEPLTATNLPKSLKQKLALFQQLFSAVAHLYSEGILHRDIKFQNTGLKLGEDGKLVLFDFGEACEKSDNYRECVGTVLNMSPEVVNFSQYSDRSELWALMCYLIELLTGKPMILHFFDDPLVSIKALHVQLKIDSLKEPPIPEAFKTDKSPAGILLLQILRRGLAIAPEERLTFPELQELLQQLLELL
jgi:serine/threonine protein kinase